MRSLWNSFKIAFSMYSKTPVPNTDWTKENMRYVMCFFPLIGVEIGLLVWGWNYLASRLGFQNGTGHVFYTAVMVLIPVLVTGGIHLDGFLDTSDAMSSWQPMEKRLEILKDSNSGAFAVIMGCVYFLLSFGAYSAIDNRKMLLLLCLAFVLSRGFSGLSIVTFQMAKNTGLARTFSDGAQKKTVGIWMIIYIIVVSAAMVAVQPICGMMLVITALLTFIYYRHMAYKNFGGITGDLAGWYLQVCELAMAVVLVLMQYVIAVLK